MIYPKDHRAAHAQSEMLGGADRTPGELWILATGRQAHSGCIGESPGGPVPGLGANSWHRVTISNWQTSVLER